MCNILLLCFLFLQIVKGFVKETPVKNYGLQAHEQRLYVWLMNDYSKAVRGVYDHRDKVVVNLGMTLHQIVGLNEREQILTLNVWLDQSWGDERLRWNPKEFDGISILRVPCMFLWRPDIVLYNSMDDQSSGKTSTLTNAMVNSTGSVFCPYIVRFKSSCKIDTTYFPFDDQICSLKLGSWLYDGFQLDVSSEKETMKTDVYVDNGEWELVETKAVRNVRYYSCCPEPYPDVTFYVHIRRRTLFYVFNLVTPCVICSALTLFAFMLPSDCGEKISLGLTILLSLFVFALVVAETIPRTSDTFPIIGIYFSVIMGTTSFSVVASAMVINMYNRGRKPYRAPAWMRFIVLTCLAQITCRAKRVWDVKMAVGRYHGFPRHAAARRGPPTLYSTDSFAVNQQLIDSKGSNSSMDYEKHVGETGQICEMLSDIAGRQGTPRNEPSTENNH